VHERLRLQSLSGGLGPSRGREAPCAPEDRVNQAAGSCHMGAATGTGLIAQADKATALIASG